MGLGQVAHLAKQPRKFFAPCAQHPIKKTSFLGQNAKRTPKSGLLHLAGPYGTKDAEQIMVWTMKT